MFLLNRHTHTHTAKAVSCAFIVLPLSPISASVYPSLLLFLFCVSSSGLLSMTHHSPSSLNPQLWFYAFLLFLTWASCRFPLCRAPSICLWICTHTLSPTRSVSCVFSKNTSVFRQRKVACFLFLDCGIFPQISEPRFFPLCVVFLVFVCWEQLCRIRFMFLAS